MGLFIALAACVNVDTLQRDFAEAERVYSAASNLNARECTPYEMAMFEANLEFTRLEFEQGDPSRAREHLDIAMENGRVALDTAPSCIPQDRDGDGLVDEIDLCPDEPEDFDGDNDQDGCPDLTYDTDGDGLFDDVDQCVDQAEDLDGFKDQDGCPELDNDLDGVADGQDACPLSPEDRDGWEDGDGCPDKDNDGDGLADVDDDCPDTAGPVNGCPVGDSDGDGYADDVDKCPQAAGGAPDGCPMMDFDKDGIPDESDQCPGMAGPSPSGCPDADGDSVFDMNDQCPTIKGPAPTGCPDSDGDGVADPVDRCPQQPENINEYMDQDGCPDTKPQLVKIANRQIVIEEKIQYETGKAVIKPESYKILDDVIQVMTDYPQIEVRIEGHTDSDGSDAANLTLSKARADSVFEYLIANGVEATRLETVGYGETRPVDTNRTSTGKANNRRVEFHITKGLD
ncbi:MAG: OmpA family protein [Proteobacteria bacterium]|nr:OmpA family protein [Pseudomonadota bacterium]MCP4916011.1 OmpA family protein [Pseudomonadota bacterium]